MRHRLVRFSLVALVTFTLSAPMALSMHRSNAGSRVQAAPQSTPTTAPTVRPTTTPIVVPTVVPITPTPPIFTATVAMFASAGLIGVGDALRVDIAVKTSPDCQFAHYESTLIQLPEEHFSYLDPPTATAGPPGATTYLLLAEATGEVTLTAQLYGERYCGDFWNWIYLPGPSLQLTVTDTSQLQRTYLPVQRAR